MIKIICSLNASCAYRRDDGGCGYADSGCGYRRKDDEEVTKKVYVRQERWYEKYYRRYESGRYS